MPPMFPPRVSPELQSLHSLHITDATIKIDLNTPALMPPMFSPRVSSELWDMDCLRRIGKSERLRWLNYEARRSSWQHYTPRTTPYPRASFTLGQPVCVKGGQGSIEEDAVQECFEAVVGRASS
ncbi:hypothetical protein Droror1_Dr00003117 [Drosera rotundifolia]